MEMLQPKLGVNVGFGHSKMALVSWQQEESKEGEMGE